MKKILLYAIGAAVLGVLLIILPLFTLTGIKVENYYALPELLTKGMERLENISGSRTQEYAIVDFRILVISFAIASVTYVLFKFRMLR